MHNLSIWFDSKIPEVDTSVIFKDNINSNGIIEHQRESKYDLFYISQIQNDEIPLASLPFFWKTILTMIIMLSIMSGSYYKSIMYRFVILKNNQRSGCLDRPIDVLIISSAIIHHFTHTAVGLWLSANLMTEIPLADMVGFQFCEMMDVIGIFGSGHLTIGGLGIAIYRMLYIKRESWVKYVIGEKLLLLIVLVGTNLFGAFLLVLFKLETSSDRFNLNMCRGLSRTNAQILIDIESSRGEPLFTSSYLRSTAVSLLLAVQAFEFSLYLWFFHHRYKNDNVAMKKILSHDVIQDRNIKNVSTFLGQFYGFLTESIFLIGTILLIQFADENTHQIKAVAALLKYADFGLLSAVEVYSSPGLRAFKDGKLLQRA